MATLIHRTSYNANAFGRTKATKIIEQSGVAMKRDGIFNGLQRIVITGKSDQVAHAVALINQAEQDHLRWRERKKDSERKKRDLFGAMPTPPSGTPPQPQKSRRLSRNPYSCLAEESDDEFYSVGSSASTTGNKKSNRHKYVPLHVEFRYAGNIRDRKRELFANRQKRREEFPALQEAVQSQADQTQEVTRKPTPTVPVSALKGDWASVAAPSVETPKVLKEEKPKIGLVALTKGTLATLPKNEVVQELPVYKKTFKHLTKSAFLRPNEWENEGDNDVFYAEDEPYESQNVVDRYWDED